MGAAAHHAHRQPKQPAIPGIARRLSHRVYLRLRNGLADGVRYAEPNFPAIGAVGVIGFPLYYVVWTYWFPQTYESLPLRLLGSLLLIPIMLADHWPARWRAALPVYWLGVILYALPFFFTFMLLKNHMSTVWGMSTMAGLTLLILLMQDWLLVMILFAAGTLLAWAGYLLTGGSAAPPHAYLEQLPIYLFLIVAGSIFNYKKELLNRERLDAMFAVSRNVAHELRTPLLGIRSGVGGLRRYLPRLLQGYALAREHGLAVEPIRQTHLVSLEDVLDRMQRETSYSNAMIDMLLVNAGRHSLDPAEFQPTSMAECVSEALQRYPFRTDRERAGVRRLQGPDFHFQGIQLLAVHVIFNLLRNALHAVAEKGEGEVTIWTERDGEAGQLHVRDTGSGIAPSVLPHIYERFYSSRGAEQGAGIGLSFCKMVTESFGGSIDCRTEHGRFTEFVLSFPGAARHG